jgi:hypothetical protein
MGKALGLSLLFLLSTSIVKAQEIPKYQVFVGPSYAREDLTDIKNINGIGWHASLDGTANNWVSAVFDFSGYYSSPKINVGLPAPLPINSSEYLYLFGPRFTYRKVGAAHPVCRKPLRGFRFQVHGVLGRPHKRNLLHRVRRCYWRRRGLYREELARYPTHRSRLRPHAIPRTGS